MAVMATVLAVVAPGASADTLLVANSGSDSVSVIDTDTNATVGSPIPVGHEPSAIAISPDGQRAYVANSGSDSVSVIDVATRTVVGSPITGLAHPVAIAVSPDGTKVYVNGAMASRLEVIDTATNAVVPGAGPLDEPAPSGGTGLAITPDGRYAYVGHGTPNNWVNKLDLANPDAEATRIHTPSPPEGGLAMDPDGSRVFAFAGGPRPIDVNTNAVGPAIGGPAHAQWIAVAPDGTRAYVPAYDIDPDVFELNLLTNTTNPAVTVLPLGPNFLTSAAITPDGSRVYVAGQTPPPPTVSGQVVGLETANNQPVGSPIDVGQLPSAIAVVPDQSPTARLAALPAAVAGVPVAFDASPSSDPDGTVARYDFNFGDGSSAADAGPDPSHVFAAGTYTVQVTAFDDEGCPSALVYTGQTASCSGSPQDAASRTLVVEGLKLGATKRNSRKGTATVTVHVPSAGELALDGKGLAAQHKTATGARDVSLKVRTKGHAKHKLKRKGKLTVHPAITFTPAGGSSDTQSLDVKLKRKRPRR